MSLSIPAPRPVLADVIPGARVRDVALVVGGAALTGLLAQLSVPVPGSPVPITGQTLGVLLVGAALGPLRGVLSMLLYMGAGLVGVPWYAEGQSGYANVSATFGYIVGFVAAAWLVGFLARRGWDRTPLRVVVSMVMGNAVIYAIGVPWLAYQLNVSLATAVDLGMTNYLLGDAIKIALAAGLLPAAWKLAGRE